MNGYKIPKVGLMQTKPNAIQFFMALSIVCILIAGSHLRINSDISKVNALYTWIMDSPSSHMRRDFPFEKPLCSLTGRRITFWKSMTFKIEFFEKGRWLFSQDGAFELTKSQVDFMWHKNENFKETDLPLPDKGGFWKSSSRDYFVHHFGNYYSNLYCSRFETVDQR